MIFSKIDSNKTAGKEGFFSISKHVNMVFPIVARSDPANMMWTILNLHYIRKFSCKFGLFRLSGSREKKQNYLTPFLLFVINSTLKRTWPFIWKILNSLYPRLIWQSLIKIGMLRCLFWRKRLFSTQTHVNMVFPTMVKWIRYQRVISIKIQVGNTNQTNKWANRDPQIYRRSDQVPWRSNHPLLIDDTRSTPVNHDVNNSKIILYQKAFM
jgi:hypothetical protein